MTRFPSDSSRQQLRVALHLAVRDHRQRFAYSSLGTLWSPIATLSTSVVLGVVWSTIFDLDIQTFMPFVVSGNAAWTLVSSSLAEAPTHIISNRGFLINSRGSIATATTTTMTKIMINSSTSLLAAIVVVGFFGQLTAKVVLLPLMTVLAAATVYPYVLIIGIIGTFWRDVEQFFPTIILLFYMTTPILFPIEQLGPLGPYVRFSPFYVVVSIMRDPLLGDFPAALTLGLLALWALLGWSILLLTRSHLQHIKVLI